MPTGGKTHGPMTTTSLDIGAPFIPKSTSRISEFTTFSLAGYSHGPPPPDYFLSEFFIDRTTVELKLSRVKVSKAPGPGGIPNWILCDFCTELSGPVCAMFNTLCLH